MSYAIVQKLREMSDEARTVSYILIQLYSKSN